MGFKLGAKLGEVMKADIFYMPNRTTIVKVRILMTIKLYIMPGMYIGSKNNGISWIDFQYEKLHLSCFYCGYMGHSEEH